MLLVNLLALLEVASAEGSQDALPPTPLSQNPLKGLVFIYMKNRYNYAFAV